MIKPNSEGKINIYRIETMEQLIHFISNEYQGTNADVGRIPFNIDFVYGDDEFTPVSEFVASLRQEVKMLTGILNYAEQFIPVMKLEKIDWNNNY